MDICIYVYVCNMYIYICMYLSTSFSDLWVETHDIFVYMGVDYPNKFLTHIYIHTYIYICTCL